MKIAAAVVLLAVAAASPEIRYFRYQRSVQNLPRQSGQACLVLDPGIFTHAELELADLRLYRGSTETPYVLRTAAPEAPAQKSIAPLNLGSRDGQTVFDAEVSAARYSDIELTVAAQNFIATVTVTGGHSLSVKDETRLGSFTIFDLTRERLGRSTVLHLPESDFPYLHFRIAGPLRPESIAGLTVEPLPAVEPKYLTVAESSRIEQKGRTTVVEFTTPAHLPVDRIVFSVGPAPALFSRDVNVNVVPASNAPRGDDTPPRPVTSSGNLLRLHSMQNGRRIDEERLAIDAPAVDFETQARWTVTIQNSDDAPLNLNSVRLQIIERSLCFQTAANADYSLYYGDPALASPRYDYATLFTPQAGAARTTVGPEQLNPAWRPRPDNRPFTERHPALLWAALIAVVALLGAIALRSANRPV